MWASRSVDIHFKINLIVVFIVTFSCIVTIRLAWCGKLDNYNELTCEKLQPLVCIWKLQGFEGCKQTSVVLDLWPVVTCWLKVCNMRDRNMIFWDQEKILQKLILFYVCFMYTYVRRVFSGWLVTASLSPVQGSTFTKLHLNIEWPVFMQACSRHDIGAKIALYLTDSMKYFI